MTVSSPQSRAGASAPGRDHEPVPLIRLDNGAPELLEAVARVAAASAFTLGEEVEAFEREFAQYCGARHAVGVSSGTEALVLALRALGLGPGDEVIVPTNSFIASAEAVSLVGATPRLVDVDPLSGLLTADLVERSIRPDTRAIIPVHLYGATVDMEPLVHLAREAGLALIEDACQAHGAFVGGARTGTLGRLGCFSFYPTKNLGGWGDGGAVVTDDPALDEQLRMLRSHGEPPGERHRHRMAATTARLDAVQAAVLRLKLRHLDEANGRRRVLAARLRSALEGGPVELPHSPADGDHVYHLFVVQSDRRDALRAHLAEAGIGSAVHYPTPIHLTEAYAGSHPRARQLPVAERLAGRICSLPLFPGMEESELERVADAVLAF
jgi:dTDP-3-amino-3,4,6-trideoxy-alpha-D-glucose transaminase